MNESRALAVRELTPTVWQMIEAVAPAMHQSRLFGVTSKEQAATIMLKGFELGLGIAGSFEFIQVIQGKPTLSPRGALALIHRCGELAGMKITERTDACTVAMKRKNGFEYEITYTMDDARKAGLVKPGGAWESYGPNMLRWRSIGFCADVVFPDVIGGLKRADELGAVIDTQGNVLEGQWEPAPVQPLQPPATTEKPDKYFPTPIVKGVTPEPDGIFQKMLDDLIEKYGVDAVLAAGDGSVPSNRQEVAAILRKLESAKSNENVPNVSTT